MKAFVCTHLDVSWLSTTSSCTKQMMCIWAC